MKNYIKICISKLKSKAPANFQDLTSDELTELTKGGSVSSVSRQGVISSKNSTGKAHGFVSFVSKKRVDYSKNAPPLGSQVSNLIFGNTTPRALPKPTKPSKQKPWRPEPLWPACIVAIQAEELAAAHQLYIALSMNYGHTFDEAIVLLRALTPLKDIPTAAQLVTQEQAQRYIAAHPFAWELKLEVSNLTATKEVCA